MKNYIVLFCLLAVCGLMSCTEKKAAEEKSIEQTPPPAEAKEEDEGVVIKKQTKEDTLKGSLKAYAKGSVGMRNSKLLITLRL